MRPALAGILTALVAGAAWLSVRSDEPAGRAKPAVAGKSSAPAEAKAAENSAAPDDAVKEIISGKVVALGAALKERGIKSYAEELKGQVVLVTDEGELIPIVPDWRGR